MVKSVIPEESTFLGGLPSDKKILVGSRSGPLF